MTISLKKLLKPNIYNAFHIGIEKMVAGHAFLKFPAMARLKLYASLQAKHFYEILILRIKKEVKKEVDDELDLEIFGNTLIDQAFSLVRYPDKDKYTLCPSRHLKSISRGRWAVVWGRVLSPVLCKGRGCRC